MIRKTLQELKIRQPSGVEINDPVRSYNLDDADSTHKSRLIRPYTLPSREEAESMVKIYFSTVHVAYPFLSRDNFENLFPQLWEEPITQTLTDSWRATFCKVNYNILINWNRHGVCLGRRVCFNVGGVRGFKR